MTTRKPPSRLGEALAYLSGFFLAVIPLTLWMLSQEKAISNEAALTVFISQFISASAGQLIYRRWNRHSRKARSAKAAFQQ